MIHRSSDCPLVQIIIAIKFRACSLDIMDHNINIFYNSFYLISPTIFYALLIVIIDFIQKLLFP